MKNKEINVLITSASRKVWLVEAFKDALKREKIRGKVISVELSRLSAALYVSDRYYLIPPSSDKNFIQHILRLCKKEKIKLLIPTRDEELIIFAKNREIFCKRGINVMISNPETIEICNDKYKFYQFLKKNKIPAPITILPSQFNLLNLKYPLIIKSRKGSGGKNVFMANNKRELEFFVRYIDEPIIQEFAEGKEYTVDLFSDFKGKIITAVPRERIEVVSGESYKGQTVRDLKIIRISKIFAGKLTIVGHITLQFIKSRNSVKLIEVNPRFGGGAMLGIKAGYDTPRLLIRLAAGRKVKLKSTGFIEDLIMLRYTKDLFILNGRVFNQR